MGIGCGNTGEKGYLEYSIMVGSLWYPSGITECGYSRVRTCSVAGRARTTCCSNGKVEVSTADSAECADGWYVKLLNSLILLV